MSNRTKFTLAGIFLMIICLAVGAGLTLLLQPKPAVATSTPATLSWCLATPLSNGTRFDLSRTQAKAKQYEPILLNNGIDVSQHDIGAILAAVCSDN